MTQETAFDPQAVHRFYSAACYNQAWDYIDKVDRTPSDNETMIELSLASVWHWKQRPDCTDQNLAVGYWQVSRIYCLVGQVENASRYGRLSLEAARQEGVEKFALGYAYEALARAGALAKDKTQMQTHLAEAYQVARQMTDLDDREQLLADLDTIRLD